MANAWAGIDGRLLKDDAAMDAFFAKEYKPVLWRPTRIVLHNTAAPTLSQWTGGPPIPTRLKNLEAYYKGKGWRGGPHAFVGPEGAWLFTPLTLKGTHSPSWNSISWGVEMVGNFVPGGDDPFSGDGRKVWSHTVSLIARMMKVLPLVPERDLFLHREDKATDHACPGSLITKANAVTAVRLEMEQMAKPPVPVATIVVNDRWREAVKGTIENGSVVAEAKDIAPLLGMAPYTGRVVVKTLAHARGFAPVWDNATKKLYLYGPGKQKQ